MGFDISKYKVPTDNGRWAETDLITALKVVTIIFGLPNCYLNKPLSRLFEPGIEYETEEKNDYGAHIKLYTNSEKVDTALKFINSGKHPLLRKAEFSIQEIPHSGKFSYLIELWETRINGEKIVIRYVDGRIYRSIVETKTIINEIPI